MGFRGGEFVKRFRVTIEEGTTTHGVNVQARSHEEAYGQAIEVLRLPYVRVGNATMRILAAILLAAIIPAIAGSAETYVGRLQSMRGESYARVSCTEYICIAKRHTTISAKDMLTSGELVRIARAEVRAGDIVDFGGVHVAANVGEGEWLDSTPRRGVGPIHPTAGDRWYSGAPVYLRWK